MAGAAIKQGASMRRSSSLGSQGDHQTESSASAKLRAEASKSCSDLPSVFGKICIRC